MRENLKYAFRQFRSSPGFAIATVLILALGIGANTALFSIMYGVLFRPLPFAHGDRLVHLGYREPAPGVETTAFSVQEMGDYRKDSRTLDQVVEYHSMNFVLLGAGEPDNVKVGVVSADFFDALGVAPIQGRSFQADDEKPGSEPVLLLTYEYWQRRFGGDRAILGRTLRMNERPITVVGILPRLPSYPGQDDVFMPTTACPFRSSEMAIQSRDARLLSAFGRLKPGVTLEQARADVDVIAGRLHREYPQVYAQDAASGVPVVPVQEELTARFRPTLLILLGAVGLVLLIACANVANLALARLVDREKEIAIRTAMGAGRGRLVGQVLTESTVLALVGGALGLLVARAGGDLLVSFASRYTLRASEVEIGGPVLLFTLAISLVSGLLFAVAPTLQLSRRNLSDTLREGSGKATMGVRGLRWLSLLVVVQVALSFVLLIGAGLALRGLLRLNNVEAGFDPDKVLVADIPLSLQKYRGAEKRLQFFQSLLERLGNTPGVRSTALSSDMPLAGTPMSQTIHIEGSPPAAEEPTATLHTASERYFQTLGIKLRRGRMFTPQDRADSLPVVIVNQSLAKAHWPGQEAIGKQLSIPAFGGDRRTIVGVVEDVRDFGLDTAAGPTVYLPFLQMPAGERIFVRTESAPAGLAGAIREAVHALDPEQPVEDIQTLEQVRSAWLAPARLTAALVILFAALAFAITALGIGGIVAFTVSERKHEMAIRSALGARRSDIFGLVLRQGMAPVVVGLVLGIGGALFLTRLLTSLLYGIEPEDPLTFVSVSLGLLAIVCVACSLPARRAVSIDPVETLRQ